MHAHTVQILQALASLAVCFKSCVCVKCVCTSVCNANVYMCGSVFWNDVSLNAFMSLKCWCLTTIVFVLHFGAWQICLSSEQSFYPIHILLILFEWTLFFTNRKWKIMRQKIRSFSVLKQEHNQNHACCIGNQIQSSLLSSMWKSSKSKPIQLAI